jgi:hypothetical protein
VTISRPETPSGLSVTDTALGLALVVAAAGRRTAHRTRVVWSPVVALAERAERTARRTPLAPVLAAVAARGAGLRRRLAADGVDVLDRLLPAVVEEALRRVDLTQVVLRHVDLDRVVAEVDVDAVVRRVDVEQVLDRVDVDEVVARADIDAVAARLDLERVLARVDVDAVAAKLDIERVLDRLDLTELAMKRLDWDVLVAAVLTHVDLEAVALDVIEAVDLPDIIRESSGALTSDTVRSARIRGAAADQALSRVRDRFRARHNGVGLPAPEPPAGS